MTRDDIIRMAREAGFNVGTAPQIERFANLVAAAEREQIADMLRDDGWLYCATMVELRKK